MKIACISLTVMFLWAGVAFAGPGEGIKLGGGYTLSPFIEGAVTYDSNVLLEKDNEMDDFFFDLIGGASLLRQGDDLSLNLRGLIHLRRYQDFTALDDDTFQENFEAVAGDRQRLEVTLNQRYSHVSDYEFIQEERGVAERQSTAMRLTEGRTRRTDRYLQDYGISLARDTAKLQTALSAGYGRVEFGDDVPIYFQRDDLRDWDELAAELDLAWRTTDKTSVFLTPGIGQHRSDNGLDDSLFWKARLGLRNEPTTKLSYDLGAGLESYRIDSFDREDLTAEETDELDQTFVQFDGRGCWAATKRLDLQLFARNEMMPTEAFDLNTKRVDQGSVGAVYEFSTRLAGTLGLSYRQDVYTLPIQGKDAHEELVGVQARLQLMSRKQWVKLTGMVRYEEFTSNIQDEYEQLRASLELNFTY